MNGINKRTTCISKYLTPLFSGFSGTDTDDKKSSGFVIRALKIERMRISVSLTEVSWIEYVWSLVLTAKKKPG